MMQLQSFSTDLFVMFWAFLLSIPRGHGSSSYSSYSSSFHQQQQRPLQHNPSSAASGAFSVQPAFEDLNGTTVVGEPGGTVTLDCNIFMLQDHTVSWAHLPSSSSSGRSGGRIGGSNGGVVPDEDPRQLDLLTIGNATYTLEPRISAHFSHPSNWGLRIRDLRPEDAGVYLCQISTFPEEKIRMVSLEIRGPMIEILREQVVYNAGSHIEVKCVFRNTTRKGVSSVSSVSADRLTSAEGRNNEEDVRAVLRQLAASAAGSREGDVPEDTLVWLHNGNRFSHRNRRRVRTLRQSDHVESLLSIKSAIVEDSGNYSCLLTASNHSDTVRIAVVDGEHSAAIYKNSETVLASSSSMSSARGSSRILKLISAMAFGVAVVFSA